MSCERDLAGAKAVALIVRSRRGGALLTLLTAVVLLFSAECALLCEDRREHSSVAEGARVISAVITDTAQSRTHDCPKRFVLPDVAKTVVLLDLCPRFDAELLPWAALAAPAMGAVRAPPIPDVPAYRGDDLLTHICIARC